tara:strand:- start:325 stop:813 length:489 start_codon:yes stop_codon:yes gene_type:complete
MVSVHHKTAARASSLGFTIRACPFINKSGTSFIVERTDTPDRYEWARGGNPKDALDQAILEYATWIEKKSDNVVVMAEYYRDKYNQKDGQCGDIVSKAMAGLEHTVVCNVAKINGIDHSVYDHLNNGMRRMNIGNRLRGKLRRGEDVIIGDETIKAEEYSHD